ncbi:hypothetical protein F0562_023625 [Nyssa sinensis]|uniref:Drought induced 19 protein type zinc-binding domain-containing protein n=1 Tax=Nyssa sinensis TaxID=561372 RepID=A0A5J5BHL6_9ASTE|nr:hypothetical protein F0562_023365 [Nyssa sinensis]KAA8542239.1 hypothetical protein F0562_023625 [Nyssa sinensis]
MEGDFWASGVHSARHVSAVQAARLNNPDNNLNINDSEDDDNARAYFPCPFCYVDIEVRVLCSHLQEEHCFDFKNVVCPLCAANLGKDVIGHFTVQHAHSVKQRRKSQKSGFWTNNSAMLGKDLRELSSLHSMNGRGNASVHESAPDPLLSPFLSNIHLSDPRGNQQDESSSDAASTTSDVNSGNSSILDEVQEEDYEERSQRAAFCQQLILSIIF